MTTHNAMVRGIPDTTYAAIEKLASRHGTSINKAILKIVVDSLDKPSIMGNVRIYSSPEPCVGCGNTAEYGLVTADGRIIGPYCISCV